MTNYHKKCLCLPGLEKLTVSTYYIVDKTCMSLYKDYNQSVNNVNYFHYIYKTRPHILAVSKELRH